MPPSRLHWPAGRRLFRQRARGSFGVPSALVVVALLVAVALSWQG